MNYIDYLAIWKYISSGRLNVFICYFISRYLSIQIMKINMPFYQIIEWGIV